MEEIDNLEIIKPLLTFTSEDDFYHLQIIKRKKEHSDIGANSTIVKTYYIKSIEHLEHIFPEIKSICTFHNARAGINLNKRSFEKVAYHTLRKVTDQILNKEFSSVRKAYESVCGTHSNASEKRWIIDIDDTSEDSLKIIDSICLQIKDLQPIGDKEIAIIPTKNGHHLICKPFNLGFREDQKIVRFNKTDVHKDNPTILYMLK